MKSARKRLTLCRRELWTGGLLSQLEPQGDRLALDVRRHTEGFVCLRAIDSGTVGFEWKRIRVNCRLPEGGSLRVYGYAADVKKYGAWSDLDTALAGFSGSHQELRQKLGNIFGEATGRSEDFRADRKGRYLWLMLELMSSGAEDPMIESVDLWLDGDHMADYLPACYQSDDFTTRFLSLFHNLYQDLEERIERIPELLDVGNTNEEMLRCLSSWVCLDGEESARLREWIPTALDDFEGLYTVEGVKRSVFRLTGREPIIIEHHTVDPNHPACINPDLHRRLYGENPFKFFVLLEENTFPNRDGIEIFLDRMKQLIPAGMELELVLLKKCVQLDWHTYLGVNSVVGGYIPVAIDENMTIHFDTVIGG